MRSLRSSLVLAILAVGGGALASEAGAVAVDVEPGGTAHFAAFNETAPLGWHLRAQAPDGTLGPAAAAAPGTGGEYGPLQDGADVQAGPDGTETLMWIERTATDGLQLRTRRRAPDGTLGEVQVVASDLHAQSPHFGYRPHVDLDAQGGAYFAWVASPEGRSFLQGRRRAPDGTLSPVDTFGRGTNGVADPQVAVDAAGNAHVLWQNNWPQEILMRRRTVNGALLPLVRLSTDGDRSYRPLVEVAPDGSAVYSWVRHAHGEIRARVRRADAVIGPVLDVSSPGQTTDGGHALAMSPDGGVQFAWSADAQSFRSMRIYTRRLPRRGTLQSVHELSDPDVYGLWPRVAVDGGNNAVVAWYSAVNPWGGRFALKARRVGADGALGALGTVTGDIRPNTADLDVDSTGRATFAWQRHTDAHSVTRRRSVTGGLSQVVDLAP